MKKIILPFLIVWFSVLVSILTFGQTATINFNNQHQIIDGFGGSSAWSGQLNNSVMNTLYKNGTNQLGFTILRCRIDPNNSWTDEAANAKNAKALGATVFATPWSPPASMKSNNNVVGGQLNTSSYAAYASYLNQFINYVGTSNIDLISLQNEPDYNPTYESCSWNGTQFHDFCLNNAGSIIKPVMMPESFSFNQALSDPTLNDPAAAKNISYVGGHLYGSQPKSYTKAINLGKHVWMTEWNATDYSANGLMVLGKQVLDCMYQDFNAYVYWWMTASGNGVISTTGTPNKYGYILSQFAKYVRPGYYRVDATYNPQTGVYVVAFKGNGNYVIVTVNNSTSSKTQQFTLQNGAVTSVVKTTTSSGKSLANDGTVTVTNGSFTTTLDAQSVTTFVGTTGTICNTAAPTVIGSVMYCQNAKAIALTANGTALKWYTVATGGSATTTAPVPVTNTSGTTSYYVSQTINGCESPRATISVKVNALPVITPYTQIDGGAWNQTSTATLCAGSSIILGPQPTTTTGWSWTGPNGYTATSREITLASVMASQGGTYTASYTDGNTCKSTAVFTLTVNAIPAVPIVTTPVTYCQNAAAAQLSATGTNLKWYIATIGTASATAPTPGTAAAGTTNYYVSQTTNTCESARALIAVTVNALPTATITTTTSTTFCTSGSVILTASAGTSYKWLNGTAAITGATAQTYTATTSGSYTVEVTNANTCKATSSVTTVTVNTAPNAPAVTTPVTYCQHAAASPLNAIGTGLKWYTTATGGTGQTTVPTPTTATAGTTYYYASQTTNTCESARALISVTVNTLPAATITANGPTAINQGDNVTLTASAGSSYKWLNGTTTITGATAQSYTASTAGSYTVKVTNANTCTATSVATNVTVTSPTVNQPSVITITSPQPNTTISGSINIAVDVTDPDGSITLVEFLDGSTVIGTSTEAPYTFTWNNPSAGTHSITVRVTDSNSGVTTSGAVSVTSEPITTGLYASNSNALNGIVYPNPSNGIVFIDSDTDLSGANFMLVDVLGNDHTLLQTSNGLGAQVDVSNLSAGTYVLIIKKDNAVMRKKITVIR